MLKHLSASTPNFWTNSFLSKILLVISLHGCIIIFFFPIKNLLCVPKLMKNTKKKGSSRHTIQSSGKWQKGPWVYHISFKFCLSLIHLFFGYSNDPLKKIRYVEGKNYCVLLFDDHGLTKRNIKSQTVENLLWIIDLTKVLKIQ